MPNSSNIGLILEYERVFNEALPQDRMNLISTLNKTEVLGLISYINFQLSPIHSARYDYTQKKQHEILTYILRLESDKRVLRYFENLIDNNTFLFNRPTNLWAITEVLNSDLPDDSEDGQVNNVQLLNFLRYYLCVNSETVKVATPNSENPSFEELNASIIAHNEYFLDVDPLYTLYRGKALFDYINRSEKYAENFHEYISERYAISSNEYMLKIASIYFLNNSDNNEFKFYYRFENAPCLVVHRFSERVLPVYEDYNLEAKHIRKSPFYNVSDNKYYLLDNRFLLEKSCDFMIWDFLFDKLIPEDADNETRKKYIKDYKSFIGYFFESYVRGIINYSFHFLKHPKPKLFDDLKIGGVEYGDIYMRKNKKILFGEVKSSNVPSNSKYGESLDKLYNRDQNLFFKNHGLTQVVKNLKKLMSTPENYDLMLDINKQQIIYPVIITNERLLTVGLFVQIFNERFNREFDRTLFPKHIIKQLQIIHISELEFLSRYINEKKLDIFDFLDYHFSKNKFSLRLSMSYRNLKPFYINDITQWMADLIKIESGIDL